MNTMVKIKNFPKYYITNNGDIYSANYRRTGNIKKLTPYKCKNGYLYVILCDNKKRCHKTIHRLVAETFIVNKDKKSDVNHKNGKRTDNRVENLEWVTRRENIQHSFNVLGRRPIMLGKSGKDHNRSKVVLQIKDGEVIAEFYGTREASRKTNIQQSDISSCCCNKKKNAGGYQWRYKTN